MKEKRTRLEELSDILDWNLLDTGKYFGFEHVPDGEVLHQFKPVTREERKKVNRWIHQLGGKPKEGGWFIPG